MSKKMQLRAIANKKAARERQERLRADRRRKAELRMFAARLEAQGVVPPGFSTDWVA
jgi:hypothetical protein